MVNVLFVCLGNICRSPTATGIFQSLVKSAGLEDRIIARGAGTYAGHVGEAPDPRTRKAALEFGYSLSHLRAQQVTPSMLVEADYVLAMDESNLAALRRLAPEGHREKPQLFLEHVPSLGLREVPDPYYGGPEGFRQVVELCEAASKALLERIRREHHLTM